MTAAPVQIRAADLGDLEAIRRIYNEGIEDGLATLDAEAKSAKEMRRWWAQHGQRFAILVAARDQGEVIGWASLNPYSHRCAHAGVADLSVYVRRDSRGMRIGWSLLRALEPVARQRNFHKIVLFALERNAQGKALYRKQGYREVGILREHGKLDGQFVDVVAMEKIL